MRLGSKLDQKLKIISLGGFGLVTQNLFVYEYGNDILVVDCGVGFPEEEQEGADLIVADTTYLERNKHKIRGIIITHGHEDHFGGLPFVLPKLGLEIPIYGSRLAMALAEEKLAEFGIASRLNRVNAKDKLPLGIFLIEFVRITHSVPDTFNLIIKTPLGTIYHAGDFKFDWTPVMGEPTEAGKIARAGEKGILLLLSDCLRSEKPGYTLSESMVGESLEREILNCQGKFLVTTMSSNISRWQQAINVIERHRRKVVPVGRSVEKIVEIAKKLGYLRLPQKLVVDVRRAKRFPPQKLAFLVAGSQAQTGSALDKIAAGEFREIKIEPGDKVVFSVDYIPGNEVAIHRLIDNLARQGADVSYSEILDDLHVSGHAAQEELALMLALTKPKYVLPIGGAFRQMKQYALLAQKMGYQPERILLPGKDQTIEMLPNQRVLLGPKVELKKRYVDSRVKGEV